MAGLSPLIWNTFGLPLRENKMKKTYEVPKIHVEKFALGVFGCYGDPDPKPLNKFPFTMLNGDANNSF